jgi:hypothetical protein
MRIRIRLVTFMRIQIRILLSTLMLIRILFHFYKDPNVDPTF